MTNGAAFWSGWEPRICFNDAQEGALAFFGAEPRHRASVKYAGLAGDSLPDPVEATEVPLVEARGNQHALLFR